MFGRIILLLGIAGTAHAECELPVDGLGEFVAQIRHLPMDSEALDGWLLVAREDGCLPIAVGSRTARGALAHARAVAGIKKDAPIVLYVNGVANTPEIACDVLREISKATGMTAIGVYNGTDGLRRDIGQVISDKMMLAARHAKAPRIASSDNQAVLTLRLAVRSELEAGRNVRVWAHSQGGAIASLGLFEAAAQGADLSRVTVTTFAAATDAWPTGARYEHYVHRGDAAPRYLGLGGKPSKADPRGRGVRVIRFGSSDVEMTANHDVLATYLPRWQAEHPGRNGSW